MLSLTRKSDYALVALSYLGQQQTQEGAVSARRISDEFGLPLPLLMNILKSLSHAGLVTSTRGPQGGYVLSQSPEEVSILDVVNAIEGPVRLALCTPGYPAPGSVPGNSAQGSDKQETNDTPETPDGLTMTKAELQRLEKPEPCCPVEGTCPIAGPIQRLNYQLQSFLRKVTLADLLDTKVDVPLEKVGL